MSIPASRLPKLLPLPGNGVAANPDVELTARQLAEKTWGMTGKKVVSEAVAKGITLEVAERSLITQAVGMVGLMGLAGYAYLANQQYYDNKHFVPCGGQPYAPNRLPNFPMNNNRLFGHFSHYKSRPKLTSDQIQQTKNYVASFPIIDKPPEGKNVGQWKSELDERQRISLLIQEKMAEILHYKTAGLSPLLRVAREELQHLQAQYLVLIGTVQDQKSLKAQTSGDGGQVADVEPAAAGDLEKDKPKCPFHRCHTPQQARSILKFSVVDHIGRIFRHLWERISGRDAFLGHHRPQQASVIFLAELAARHLQNPVLGLVELHKKYGAISYMETVFGQRAFFVSDSAAVRAVLLNTDKSPDSPFEKSELGIGGIAKLTGRNTIFLGLFDSWRDRHTLMRPYLASKTLEATHVGAKVLDVVDRYFGELRTRVENAGPNGLGADISVEMTALTMNVLLDALFDYHVDAQTLNRDVGPAFAAVTKTVPFESLTPLTSRLSDIPLYPGSRTLAGAYSTLDKLAGDILSSGRRRSQKRQDMLDALMNAVDQNGKPLSDKAIKNEILTMLLAGHETTSATVTWALYSLSQNPDSLRRLMDEISKEGAKGGTVADRMDRRNYGFLSDVIQETLRLYSPAYVLFRHAKRDATVEVNGKAYFIPANSHVVLSTFVAHRQEKQWGVEATGYPAAEFHPERFDQENIEARGLERDDLARYPFGHGPRRCMGEALSLLETKVILVRFLEQFEFNRQGAPQARITSDIGIKPKDGMKVTLRVRK